MDTWQVSARVMEALQVMSLLLKMRKVKALVQVFVLKALLKVMSLLQEVVQVKALLKVADVFSLLSPLTRTQTTMPQTRLAARTSR